jgi:hypothetical protein
VRLGLQKRLLTVFGHLHAVAGVAEGTIQEGGHPPVIFNDQDSRRGRGDLSARVWRCHDHILSIGPCMRPGSSWT